MATEKEKGRQAETQVVEGASLLDEIVQATKISPQDEAYSIARRGVEAFLHQLLEPGKEVAKISGAVLDQMVAEVDKKLSLQIDAIMHASEFQKLESAWRSLKYLVDKTDFRENVKIELLNVSKENLLEDFEDSPEVVKSGLYKIVYTAEYGQFGGQPYGAMVANYEFGPGPQDIKLLQYVASVAAMSHAPFIAAAGPGFFGLTDFSNLPNLKDLKSIFEGPQYTKWQSFRETEDARYVALTMPRFLLRLPYGPETVPVKKFNYQEDVSQGHEPTSGGTPPSRSPRASPTASRSTAGARTSSARRRRRGRGPAAPPVRGDGRDPDEDPDRDPGLRAARVRARGGGLHRPHDAQGQRQRRLLLGELRPEAEVLRDQQGREGGGAQLQARHAAAVHVRHQPPRALPQGAPAREDRYVEGAIGSGDGAQQLDRPVRVRHGEPLRPPSGAAARCGRPRSRSRTSTGSRAGTGST